MLKKGSKQQLGKSSSFSDPDDDAYTEIDDFVKPTATKNGSQEEEEDEDFHDYEMMSEHYMTIGDFTAGIGDGLSFKSGKEVSVITKNPSGWWYVEMDSKEGWVPSSYLEKVYSPSGGGSKGKDKAKETPAVAKQTPAVTKQTPAVAKQTPAVVKQTPAVAKQTPAVAKQTPAVAKPPEVKKILKSPPVKQRGGGGGGDSESTPSGIKMKLKETSSVPLESHRPSVAARPVKSPGKPSVGTKPKPAIPRVVTNGGTDGGEAGQSSVAAMAAALSKGMGRKSTSQGEVEITPHKPLVPKRTVPVGAGGNTLSVKRDSLKRSSSTDDIEGKKTRSPPPLKPRPNEFIQPPQRGYKSTSSSPQQPMGRRFLRKSTENLTEIDNDTPATSQTSSNKLDKPQPPPARKFTQSDTQTRPTMGGARSNQTIKLGELEKTLSKKPLPGKRVGPSPPLRKNTSTGSSNGPPKRPQTGPNKSTQAKRAPPPRPGNSPAQSRKPSLPGSSPTQSRKSIYVTIADYSGDEGSLSFIEGENVDVIEKNDEGWWFVSIKGNEGWIPSTFIEKTTSAPERPVKPPQPAARKSKLIPKLTENSCRAVGDYNPPVYEDSGICLKEGEIYEVIERTDGGWWYVQYGDKEGWAPSSFLEPAS